MTATLTETLAFLEAEQHTLRYAAVSPTRDKLERAAACVRRAVALEAGTAHPDCPPIVKAAIRDYMTQPFGLGEASGTVQERIVLGVVRAAVVP